MDFEHQRIAKDSYWYRIVDGDSKEYGLFSLNSVLPKQPQYSKHMELTLNEDIASQVIDGDFQLLFKLCRFVFDSVVDITYDSGMSTCKLRARDDLVLEIYRAFAEVLATNDDYRVTTHGRWIVIEKKAGKENSSENII